MQEIENASEDGPETFIPTLTVKSSWAAKRPDGRAGLGLESIEEGSVVFELTLSTLYIVRNQLELVEAWLKKTAVNKIPHH